MTLIEIEESTGVPMTYLIEHLQLPHDAAKDEGVSKLGKNLGFDIDDVRRVVRDYEIQE